jgi:SOS-response transcriptional repressor LexA
MTEKERRVYDEIKKYIKVNKIPPTVRELKNILGCRSTSTVHRMITNLNREGYISKRNHSPRSIAIDE